MSFWQLLTSLFTDRDEDKAVVVVPPLTSSLRRSQALSTMSRATFWAPKPNAMAAACVTPPSTINNAGSLTASALLFLPLFTEVPGETVWKIQIGLDLGCSKWPKQEEDVPSRPLEPLTTGAQALSSYFPDTVSGR